MVTALPPRMCYCSIISQAIVSHSLYKAGLFLKQQKKKQGLIHVSNYIHHLLSIIGNASCECFKAMSTVHAETYHHTSSACNFRQKWKIGNHDRIMIRLWHIYTWHLLLLTAIQLSSDNKKHVNTGIKSMSGIKKSFVVQCNRFIFLCIWFCAEIYLSIFVALRFNR